MQNDPPALLAANRGATGGSKASSPVAAAREAAPSPVRDSPGLPTPDFQGMRRVLRLALAAAIVFPLVFILVSAYWNFKDRVTSAGDIALRSARIAEEHALKLFDIDAALTARLSDALGTRDDAAIHNNEAYYHALSGRLGGGYPQVAAISVFGTQGQLLVSTKLFPVPAASIGTRADFRAVADAPAVFYLSGPMRSQVTQAAVFNLVRGRSDAQGHFLGVVSIAMDPDYFKAFYRDVVGADSPMHMGLIRADGAVLAWYPSLKNSITVLAPDTPFMQAAREMKPAGLLRMRSSLDGGQRIVAYRRVGGYDAYVTAGYPMSAVWAGWARHMTVVGAATLLPSLALWLFLLISMRRLTAEQALWSRLSDEAASRAVLEKAQREHQQLETLGNLVGTVAHDFNNLLMSVSANAQTSLRSTGPVTTQLHAILRAVDTGQALTRRLLGVARKQPLREEVLDVNQWANEFALVRAALGEATEFVLDLDPQAWTIRVDAAEFELAVLNVAINARDAMPQGGRFVLAVHNVTLPAGRLAQLPAGDYLRLSMTDSGVGMPAPVRARAFEPFFSTKAFGQGSGLGLSQALAFCERSGGAISLASEPGQGTEVTFYLPRAHAGSNALHASMERLVGSAADPTLGVAAAPVEPAAAATAPPPDRSRVLLVEDDAVLAEAEQVLLETLGYRVKWVPDARQALDELDGASEPIDIVLSDVQMPGGLSGIDLAEQLKRERPALPVILLTGYAIDAERLQALDVPVFSKPFDVVALHEQIVALARKPVV
jgi:signal transduction histidine kinase